MTATWVILISALATPAAFETPADSHLSLDLGGAGLSASLNYENLVVVAAGRHRLLARAGLGYLPLYIDGDARLGSFVLPLGAHYLVGRAAHHLELGVALPVRLTLAGDVDPGLRRWSLSWAVSIGYRYQDFDAGRYFVAVGYAPRIARGALGWRYRHWARLSVGVRL